MQITHDGHSVTVKDLRDLTSGDADDWQELAGLSFELPDDVDVANITPQELQAVALKSIKITPELMRKQRAALFAVMITGWDLGLPLPSEDIDVCRKIPLGLARELEQALQPHVAELQRRPDPKGQARITSSGSNGSSRGGPHSSRRASTAGRSRTS